MSFIGYTWDNSVGRGDLDVRGGRFAAGDPLVASALVLLLTRRQLPETPTGDSLPTVPRGWWASSVDGDVFGSRLWTLRGAPNTLRNRRLAVLYSEEALAPWLEQGIAREINVTAESNDLNRVDLRVQALRPDGSIWEHVWQEVLFDGL